ncbi:amidohydrolase [Chromobacterium phragmitis]|uniref:M20 aminoacylase family protein n=1 Tax=Chromobacterium phragmitis TaxID=2202141 RepID=UPI000DECA282|nr:M20 aminoacylase family protein [Chromobacterium phragmitis]AXE31362.1 amidohydrolase [Chromobacterium phragmitis]
MHADRQGRLDGYAMLSAAAVQEMASWRQDLHRHPETAFDEHRTAGKIAGLLRSFGLEVATGIGRTGVVGTLRAGEGKRAIGLRADMDALHLHEQGDVPHRSRHDGRMHACGHDGHCAMLLGAAKHLAESRSFDGAIQFIFQPAEENEGGGQEMMEDGLFERFPVDGVYGMHNWPGLPLGQMAMHPGPMMMAFDLFEIRLCGKGGHAAMPERVRDVVVAQAQLVTALQSIVSRNVDPLDCAVLSVTQVEAGSTWNIIPEQALLRGTVRYVNPAAQAVIESRMRALVDSISLAMGVEAEMDYWYRYPATINAEAETSLAADVAASLLGVANVRTNMRPSMASEDFAFMLQARPGCYAWLGVDGPAPGAGLHSPHYDFNDQALAIGAAYWIKLAETALAPAAKAAEQ